MSNQDPNLNDVMPADEQEEALRDALLGHHFALMSQMARMLEQIRSTPGAMTPEVAEFFGNALSAQEQWLASHGIVWPLVESSNGPRPSIQIQTRKNLMNQTNRTGAL
ncbi:hypothetical protein [Pseudarthrobacter sp. ATCC 49987]|uniref:hypothetical protein n=1 Tax=Pseudarthrobacter sp. ATCC 49987 TaxID=2698204 RepID=UPI001369DC0B|nr:hypothetical protein [Pseudarthrobacter sp. ATCC 49987]